MYQKSLLLFIKRLEGNLYNKILEGVLLVKLANFTPVNGTQLCYNHNLLCPNILLINFSTKNMMCKKSTFRPKLNLYKKKTKKVNRVSIILSSITCHVDLKQLSASIDQV